MDKTLSDQIDLMALLAKAYRGIKRNLVLFVALPAVGVGLALVISFNAKDQYSSSMMISTDLISKQELEFIIDALAAADSIMPGLTAEEARQLTGLRFTVENKIEHIALRKDVSVDHEIVFLQITAHVTDPQIFPSLERKILRYINTIEPIVQNRRRQEFLNREMIAKIDSEISKLNGISREPTSKAMAGYINPASMFAKTVELFEDRTEREARLRDVASVHLTKGFGSLMKDAKLPRTIICILGFMGGLFLFVLIMFAQYFNQYNRSLK
jgi:hypothetical protein